MRGKVRVGIRGAGGGKARGSGVLFGPALVLTCAHVVNDALGRAPFEMRQPGLRTVQVVVHGGASQSYEARVAYWVPPRRANGDPVRPGVDPEWQGDLAVLRLDTHDRKLPLPPHRTAMEVGQQVRSWHGGAHAGTFADATVTSCDDCVGYVDGAPTGAAIGPAYSGGPLWCDVEGAVVGLVAAAFLPSPGDGGSYHPQQATRRSWAIPWQRAARELRAVGALDDLHEEVPGPDETPFVLLSAALDSALPSAMSRLEAARDLALACDVSVGSELTPPSVADFVTFLLSAPRALPAFSEWLRRRYPTMADAVLDAGRMAPGPLLLTQREHTQLHQLLAALGPHTPTRLAEAVRAALPKAAALEGGSLDTLLGQIEPLDGDSRSDEGAPRVPGLLRVLEYLASMHTATERAGLHLWTGRVATRLGIPHSALAERRSDARDWAQGQRRAAARARLLVEIGGVTPERYRMRVWCDEGAGPRQVSTDSTTTYTGTEAAREILRTLESLALACPDDRRPLVEVLVDRAGLNLPVDEWEGNPDDLVPGVLGAEFPLTVNCPEIRRQYERFTPEWRRRWQRLDSGSTLYVRDPGADARSVYGSLLEDTDAVRVAVDVPREARDAIVQVCLAVGVPAVVWDRLPGHGSHAVDQVDPVPTRELPDGVRAYRAKTVSSPVDHPGRPVLAWADADRSVPRLHLTEPEESTR